jgi:uncharacterized SAM-binding protein YcdF (DUF218 family)
MTLQRLKYIGKKCFIFIFTSAFVYILFTLLNIYLFSKVNQLKKSDAAVVLGASAWNERPSPVFQERINHGIWLYKNGYVQYLIFTGGKGRNAPVSEAAVAKNYAIKNDIPPENIFIEELSVITFENLFYAKQIIKAHNFNDIIVVSDPMHMKRALTMAKDLNLHAYSSPTPTTKFVSLKTKTSFLFYELFFYIGYELYKYLFFIATYLFLFGLLFLMYCYREFVRKSADQNRMV